MKLLITGDFFVSDKFRGADLIDSSVTDLFDQADFRIINLEAPITPDNSKNRIIKTGPHLRMSEDTVMPYLKQLNVDMVTLANNHILDYGAKGLFDTSDALKKEKIDYVGAGNNLTEATQHYTLEKNGLRIAILNFCENEWSIAEEEQPGANPLDIIDNIKQIKSAKATHDKVICIIHGGHEYYQLPSPRMVKQYRFYVDNGADAIVGHHTHCIGGWEIYRNAPILYGLGNFVFTLASKDKNWNMGLVTTLKIEQNNPVSFELFPVKQRNESFVISGIKNGQASAIFHHIDEINTIISDESLHKMRWEDFVARRKASYINYLVPSSAIKNRTIRALLNRSGISKLFINRRYLMFLLNLTRCESHRDGVMAAIRKTVFY